MLKEIKGKVQRGERISRIEALELFSSDDIFSLGLMASHVAQEKNGLKVFFVRNRHINPTNICINRCRFCAFSRSKGEEGAYELSIAEIIRRLGSSGNGLREIHIVGGLHPDRPLEYYLEMLSAIREEFPVVHIKAFTAVEIDHMSKISGKGLDETLTLLKQRGLDAMPGGGAEIFNPDVRKRLCPEKITGKRWLEVHETAHRYGIKTNATMLYGHIETVEDRIDHLWRLRDLQDRTGGFQAFIPLSYHPENNDIGGGFPSGIDDLKTIAVSRVFLDNFSHIKAYWIMLGEKLSQVALLFGADDIEGTVIEERITHSAGGRTSEGLGKEDIVHLIRRAGRVPVERDALYNELRVYR